MKICYYLIPISSDIRHIRISIDTGCPVAESSFASPAVISYVLNLIS